MKGGKILSNKKRACILKPAIKCKNKKTLKNNNISKILVGSNANKKSKKEMNMNKTIKKLKKSKKWSKTFSNLCDPPDYNTALSLDKDLSKCFKVIKDKQSTYDSSAKMLVGEYGGITLKEYFDNKFKNKNNLNKKFYDSMKDITNVLYGLKVLSDNNISHFDIKYDNIVYDNKLLKIIDFGLSNKINNVKYFKDIGYREFNGKRLYFWYPLEFIFYNNTFDISDIKGRKFYDTFSDIYGILKLNEKQDYKILLKEYKNMIKKLDTYSFGIMMVVLLMNNDLIKYIDKNDMIKDFFNLFKRMCEPLYKKRISITEAYNYHNKLINKYS